MDPQYRPMNGFYVVDERAEQLRRETARQQVLRYKEQRMAAFAEELSSRERDEYAEDHLNHLLELEVKTLPDVGAIDRQTEIQWYMRPYLLDFLIEAHAALGLLPQTLHLAVNILDRYCSIRIVYRKHYQLLGCTALLIAAKYEEAAKKVPRIPELSNMCCHLYEEDMFVQMERHVMDTIQWQVGAPTIVNFLEMMLDDGSYDPELGSLASYLAEISLFSRTFVSKLPSEMAKVSLTLARLVLQRPAVSMNDWSMQFDTQTLVALSQEVRSPSQILQHKYRVPHLCRATYVLEEFLRRHDMEVASRTTTHLTVPSQSTAASRSVETAPYATPVKQSAILMNKGGYMTPPITPENENFAYGAPHVAAKRQALPLTPPTGPSSVEQRPVSYHQGMVEIMP